MVFSFSNERGIIEGHMELSNNQERSSQMEVHSSQGLFTYLTGKIREIFLIARN